MNALATTVERVLRALSVGAAVVGGIVMAAMLCVVVANIVMRPLGGGVRGVVEISGYLCALAVGLCMPAAQLAGSHINAGLWEASLPAFVRRAQKAAGNFICLGLLALVSRELFSIAEYARDMGEYIDGFGFSYYGMAIGFAFGIGLHAVLFLHALCRAVFPPKEAA